LFAGTGVIMDGKDLYVISAKYILAVFMEHVLYHGNATVTIAGEVFFVTGVCISPLLSYTDHITLVSSFHICCYLFLLITLIYLKVILMHLFILQTWITAASCPVGIVVHALTMALIDTGVNVHQDILDSTVNQVCTQHQAYYFF
jgi:hypothetical protein